MKKGFLLIAVLVVAFVVAGCAPASFTVDVSPNPMVFTSGSDIVDPTLKVVVTGFGPITIEGIKVEITDGTTSLYSFDSTGNPAMPISIPFVASGMTKEFKLSEYATAMTVDEIIQQNGAQYGITDYSALVGREFSLKVDVWGTTSISNTSSVQFQ